MSLEYYQFINRRTAHYKKIMVKRKLQEVPAITAFITVMDELNEQFAEKLVRSVRHNKRSVHIIGH